MIAKTTRVPAMTLLMSSYVTAAPLAFTCCSKACRNCGSSSWVRPASTETTKITADAISSQNEMFTSCGMPLLPAGWGCSEGYWPYGDWPYGDCPYWGAFWPYGEPYCGAFWPYCGAAGGCEPYWGWFWPYCGAFWPYWGAFWP